MLGSLHLNPELSVIMLYLLYPVLEGQLSGCHCVVSLLVFDMAFHVCDEIDVFPYNMKLLKSFPL
jgi:hypothetical protein